MKKNDENTPTYLEIKQSASETIHRTRKYQNHLENTTN